MTDKQRLFAEEYVANGCKPAEAYMKVYENCKKESTASTNACKLLKNTNVSAYVRELQDKVTVESLVCATDIVKDLIAVKNRCMQAVPVMKWDSDKRCYMPSDAEYTFDSKGANQALKQLGDILGISTKNVNLKGELDTTPSKLDSILEQIKNG